MKKCMLILMLVCLPVLVQADRVIGDFEDKEAVSDGWAVQGTTTWMQPEANPYGDRYGSTYRDRSRQVTVQGGVQDVIKKDAVALLSYEMKHANTLTMDVTTRNDGPSMSPPLPLQLPDGILNVKMVFVSNVGTFDLGLQVITVTAASKKTSLTWTIPQELRDGFTNGSITVCDLLLQSETGAAGGTFWIDNIRLHWTSVSYVVSDFEDGMDGWTLANDATSVFSTVGVTSGIKSMELTIPGDWKTVMTNNMMPFAEQMKKADTFLFDLSARNDIGLFPEWWMQVILEISGDAGFFQLPNAYGGLPWSLSTFRPMWAIPQAVRDKFADGTMTNCTFNIITNSGDSGGKFWIDKMRFEWPRLGAYDPIPENQSKPGPDPLTTLCWTNQEGVVLNEVYLGTSVPNPADPNQTWRNTLTLISSIENPAQQQCLDIPAEFLPLTDNVLHYWIVDGYRGQVVPGEPNVPGDLWEFMPQRNHAPVFDLGPAQYHWLGEDGTPGEVVVVLNPTVTDDGIPVGSSLAYTWTKSPSVEGQDSPRIGNLFFPQTDTSLTLPFTVPGRYEIVLAVTDGMAETKDTVRIYVGTNPCDAYRRVPGATNFKSGDFNQDCLVNLNDLQQFAANWLNCSDFLTDCQ